MRKQNIHPGKGKSFYLAWFSYSHVQGQILKVLHPKFVLMSWLVPDNFESPIFSNLNLKTWIIILSVFCYADLFAQPGSIDSTFNPTDVGFGFGDGADGSVLSIFLQSDGKNLIGGSFTSYNGKPINRIARLNTDGTLDASFNPGTGANNAVRTIILQPDGKILIGGAFGSCNGTARNRIARLNSDGTIDTGFNPGTGLNGDVYGIALQPDGKIILVGAFSTFNGTARNNIARLNSDGTLDSGFNPGTGANSFVYTVALQPDGKIIIGGLFVSYNGTSRNGIARLNADGTLDFGFNPGTGANNSIKSIGLQSDGKIAIAGNFTLYNGTARNRIARLNSDGTLDVGFNPGTGVDGTVEVIVIQSDGKILTGGVFTLFNGTARNRIVRLSSDGTLDTGFNPGTGASTTVSSCALQADGKILIGGSFASFNGTGRNYFTRLNSEGTLDFAFNPGTGANSSISTTTLQPGGKIIIGGNFTIYNGTGVKRITRLNSDGNLDSGFNPGTGANSDVYITALQPDGKIIIGGRFTTCNDIARNCIARLNADGTLDFGFNPGTGANADVLTMALQSDGKILIGGAFSTYNGTVRNCIARVNADGTLDSGFNPGAGANFSISAIKLQTDGKIIIGGGFTAYNGIAINYITRLNPDGTIDASFNPGTGANNGLQNIALQPDGKIIIGGLFTAYNGTAINYIARLNSDGTVDASFNPGTGANSIVNTIALQTDGKIVVGGFFTSFNGTTRNRIARLNSDGTLDVGFNPGTGPSSFPGPFAIQPDGKIIIGGSFSSYNGTGRNRLARIFGTSPPVITSFTPASGCAGFTAVTISGAFLTGATSVKIGGTEVGSFTVNSSTEITATIGSGTTGTIQVTTPAGITTSSGTFMVNSVPYWYLDADNDHYYTGSGITQCDSPGAGYQTSGFLGGGDCDDADNSKWRTANRYTDADGDGYGTGSLQTVCYGLTIPSGYVTNNTDCEDADPARHATFSFYADADGDGKGAGALVSGLCAVNSSTPPAGYSTSGTDCDDADNSIWRTGNFYTDADGDNYTIGSVQSLCYGASTPAGYSASSLGTDCDDADNTKWRTASRYTDADGDGYGVGSLQTVCYGLAIPSGYVTNDTDCDDADNTIWRTGDFYTDADGDNYTLGAAQSLCYGASTPAGYSASSLGTDCDDANPSLNTNCTSYIWTGASNGDWNNASNWNSNVVPGGGTDVLIPAGTTNTISTGGTFNCHSATIQAGAAVSISSGGVWNIGGDMQGASGAVITGAGKVVLNGTSAQNIEGTVSVSNLLIGNNAVQIASGSSLSILPTASSPNALLTLLSASSLTNNGNLILRSNSFGTGSIGPVPANAILAGNITQERLMPSSNGWYFIGAPVKSSSLTEWTELNTRISPKMNASFFEYSETDSTTGEVNEVNGWKVPNTLAAAINPGNEPKGYRIYLGASNPTRLASVTGLPFVQEVNKALSFSPTSGYAGGGWNLIANPYPCAIDWNQVRNDAANSGLSLSNAYYTFNGAAGNYGTYTSLNASTGVGVGGLQENIASSQAFFVKASGSSTLAFKESFKNTAANSASFLRTATSELEFLKFKVQQGSQWDEAGVLFYPSAAEGLDNYDALNLTGSAVDVATVMADGKNAAIEVLPEIGEQRILPLKVQTPSSGAAAFRFEGMENFPSTISMYLKDDFLGSLTDIRQHPEISFEAEAGQVYNRFSLILAGQVLTGSESKLLQKKLSLHPNPASNRVSVYSPVAGELELINAIGQKITTQTILSGRNEVNLTGLPKGMYQLRLKGWSVEKLIVE